MLVRTIIKWPDEMILVGLVGFKLNSVLARRLAEWEARPCAGDLPLLPRRGRRGKERLDREQTKVAVGLYRSGLSMRQVARQLGIGKTTVLELLDRQGEPVRPPHHR